MVGEDALRPRLHFSLMVRTLVVRMYWINVGLGVRVRVDGEDLCSTHVLSCIGSMLNASAITKLDVCHHTTSVDAAGTHQRAGERDQPYLGILRVDNKSTKWIKTPRNTHEQFQRFNASCSAPAAEGTRLLPYSSAYWFTAHSNSCKFGGFVA